MNDKVPIDEDDIEELLELAVEEYSVHLRTEKWMPAWFVEEAEGRVADYVQTWPDTAESWRVIGFEVD
jgi:nitroreductase